VSTVALTILVILAGPQLSEPRCCGPCICDGCNVYEDESMSAKQLVTTSSDLFSGTVVSQGLLECCDTRAEVTFAVLRRWKGADSPRIIIRTAPCKGIYPLLLGHTYLVSALRGPENEPPLFNHCNPPVEASAAYSTMRTLDQIRDTTTHP
jgi:hypothetical protein